MITELAIDDPQARAAWHAYVDGHAEATLFHGLAWVDAVRRSFPHRPRLFIAHQADRIVGVLPTFEIRSFLAGRLLVSMPYAVYGGVLSDHNVAADALLDHLRRTAERDRIRCIDLRSRIARHAELDTVSRYATFIGTVPADPDAAWLMLPRKARAAARHAVQRHGLSARYESDQLDTVWRLYSESMRRLGSPNVPRRFFHALIAAHPDRHLVSVLYQGSTPVAGLLSFVHRETVLPYYSGCASGAGRLGANNYLYLSLMQEAGSRGLRQFDFGRTRRDNHGAWQFKCNQGFEPTPLEYQCYVPDGHTRPDLSPTNRRYRLAQWAWRHLPLQLTRPLGAWVSHAIPG